jgi:hypothetical protein
MTIRKREAAAFLANPDLESGGLTCIEEIDESGNDSRRAAPASPLLCVLPCCRAAGARDAVVIAVTSEKAIS